MASLTNPETNSRSQINPLTNSRSQIILALLEDLKLHERLDLMEFLRELTDIFYHSREKYIKCGDDEMAAKELAMEDVKNYVLAEESIGEDAFKNETLPIDEVIRNG